MAEKFYPAINDDPPVGGDLTGTASNAQIAANAVGTTEIANLAVTAGKIASGVIPTFATYAKWGTD